jgi:hypothetical protein
MVILPPTLREHPVESLLAAGLLLALLVGASTVAPDSQANQPITAAPTAVAHS